MFQIHAKDGMLNDINQLREIIEEPRLFLDNYFSQLRNQVDHEIATKKINEQNDSEKINRLHELWQEMILKIDSFEKNCIENQLNDMEPIADRLKSIEFDLNQELQDFNEIKQKIKHEELIVFRSLFQNKTIIFLLADYYEHKELINGKLIIINDEYIDHKNLKLRETRGTKMVKLDSESLKIIEIERKLFSYDSYILEENLNLNNLQELNLEYFYIAKIDSNAFFDLFNLRKLNLKYVKMNEIAADSFTGLKNIEELIISHGQLKILNTNSFRNLNSLKRLDLGDNHIKYIDPRVLRNLVNLQTLHLNANQIEVLIDDLFQNLSNLQTLNLNTNRIRQINSGAFRGLNNLNELYLIGNEIAEINFDAFKNLTNLKQLNLRANLIEKKEENSFKIFLEKVTNGNVKITFE